MLIFSDVDGTLLDDDGSCRLPTALLHDAAHRHQVVLASSRDPVEIVAVQQRLGFGGWAIAEDGGVILGPGESCQLLGSARAELLDSLSEALTATERHDLLQREPAVAQRRMASVLLPIDAVTPTLRARLEAVNLQLTAGGRWATVTAGTTKGRAARVVAERLGVTHWAAIGNAPNDATLLGEAGRSFVIRNPDGHDPVLARITDAVLLAAPGPEGWLEMLRLLDQPTGPVPGKESHRDHPAVDHHHPDDSRS